MKIIILSVFIIVFLLSFLSLNVFQISLLSSNKSFVQAQELTSPSSTTTDSEAVTSTNDAIIKSILIISQVTILGITFNHIFFKKILKKKNVNQINNKESESKYFYQDISYEKRFTKLVLLCAIFIIFASSGSIILQTYELSQQLQLDLYTAFSILFSASVGQVWIIRILTS